VSAAKAGRGNGATRDETIVVRKLSYSVQIVRERFVAASAVMICAPHLAGVPSAVPPARPPFAACRLQLRPRSIHARRDDRPSPPRVAGLACEPFLPRSHPRRGRSRRDVPTLGVDKADLSETLINELGFAAAAEVSVG
jgi:hypothetical protein